MLALLIPGVGMGGGTASPPVFSGTIPDISKTENTGTHSYDLSAYFTGATSYSISPAVEAGWSFNTATAEFVIDTDDVSVFGPYVVTGTNVVGSDDSNGFTVTVVAAADSAEQPAGGWLFLNEYEAELIRRRARDRRLRELEEETERIEDKIDREIAQLLRVQEAKDEKREDFARLAKLAKDHADIEAARQYGDRVARAFARAIAQGNYSSLEALDRELKRARDEEEQFLLLATMMLLH